MCGGIDDGYSWGEPEKTDRPVLIGISAKAKCGKSTLTKYLLERVPGLKRAAIFDEAKGELAEMLDLPVDVFTDQGLKGMALPKEDISERIAERCPELLESFRAAFEHHTWVTMAELMLWYGDARRAENQDYFVKRFMERVGPGVTVVDDIRMPNEADAVRESGGILVRLNPYPGWKPDVRAGHITETALDGYGKFHLTLNPAFGRLDKMADDVAEIIKARVVA